MTEEYPAILKDYILVKDIGEGNFGKVKLSILKSTKEKYAIKILDKQKLKSQTKSTLYNEIEIISRLRHPNIIYVDKIIEDTKNYYIIMEYCEKGELFDYIVEKERLSPIEASIFFYQLINGVDYIHKQGFSHRDLKPENLLLTKEKILKIIDFGLCHDFNEKKVLKTKCGSPSYAAPEILKGFPYDGFKTDIWCCGIILYAMLCGYLPFDGDDNQEIFQSIVECEPEFPNFLEDDSINLLIWLLNPEPKDRITMEEIKLHPFYLKGKNFYDIQYEENEDNDDDSNIDEIKNLNIIYNSVDKKKSHGFSTIRKKKGNIYTFNNIKRIKMKENKRFKNNIYQNIFNNLINLNDEENSPRIKNKKSPYLLTSFNNNEKKQNSNEPENLEEAGKTKNNKIIGLINNIQKDKKQSETEGNEDKTQIVFSTNNNRVISNKIINQNDNKDLSYNKNNNDINIIKQNINQKSQEKKHDIINAVSLDINKFKQNKFIDKRKGQTIAIKNRNKFLNENIKHVLKDKNQDKQKNNKDKKVINEQLDFFQKFIINKNKVENTEKSPTKKNIEINCNLILTKKKEKNHDDINKNDKERESCENKNLISVKDRIILTQKRKNNDSIKKESFFTNNKINIINSPGQNISNNFQRNNKNNKILNSIFKYNSNKNNINNRKTTDINNDKTNYGCRSCSIKKAHRRKNLKISINKGLNNLKIINLNTKSNTIKKEIRKNNFMSKNQNDINNNNFININTVLKTEPKNNHFLDKVIQKINSNKERKSGKNKMNILSNNNFKNDDNKQMFRFLSIEKNNNNDFLGNAFLLKYYKNNMNDEDKVDRIPTIHLKEDNHFLHTINQKIDNNLKKRSKDKSKKIFPNLMIYNKL